MEKASASSTVLLDTNILLAALIDPERLPAAVRSELENPDNVILFSAASIWEVAIKRSLLRDDFDFEPEDIEPLALQTGFAELPVLAAHCRHVRHLPWHHRDPFDRLLIAQAQSLPAHLLTTDAALESYSVLVRRVIV
ncbi:type II toxin-antitoxin system VapC family toxin [Pseudothauera nasutitermitis]|uniref:Type II toxin-antitoxin system VapC family toxin n=1 Tax=Pseudothauera nasutitermitis TaxID=2565930 RepID=A0A4S4B7Q3_9RHOO|nr:type II toxin-antitoxin system VapC family toxin [Pseudothauera nasutitermitis]THF67043.1 type II toxin-antitoxin system VapC family toxin [Pseudothauera nasutitermitis]